MQTQLNAIEQYLSLTEVAKIAPGRPSTNCVWRWCRRGIKSRAGERVRLQHVRIGGMIFSAAAWLNDFGRCLAESDARYFDLYNAAVSAESAQRCRRQRIPSQFEQKRSREIEAAERELDRLGI